MAHRMPVNPKKDKKVFTNTAKKTKKSTSILSRRAAASVCKGESSWNFRYTQ